jgi:cyclohexyl-isocyanide hydratase
MPAPIHIGLLLFPNLTQLDATGPYEVFARIPGARIHLAAKAATPVASDQGLAIVPTATLDDTPPLDVVCVPGGVGVNTLLEDDEVLAFLRRQAEGARFVTSVCTGALALGAAGLLRGYHATTHWMALEFLRAFGAEPVAERVVVDRNRITGAGVTAGIDFALTITRWLVGEEWARAIQLQIEYDPAPPFDSGSPRSADPALVARVRAAGSASQEERRHIVERAAARLK